MSSSSHRICRSRTERLFRTKTANRSGTSLFGRNRSGHHPKDWSGQNASRSGKYFSHYPRCGRRSRSKKMWIIAVLLVVTWRRRGNGTKSKQDRAKNSVKDKLIKGARAVRRRCFRTACHSSRVLAIHHPQQVHKYSTDLKTNEQNKDGDGDDDKNETEPRTDTRHSKRDTCVQSQNMKGHTPCR